MRKIVLLCGSGMSTSLLAARMKEEADREGYPCTIVARATSDVGEVEPDTDLILLGPQVRFQQKKIEAQVSCPVAPIEFTAYGRMDGEKVFKMARGVIGD